MIEAKFVRSRLWLGILTVSCCALGAHDVEIVGCETGKIMASDADELDGFGERLSVHGDLAIVGAWNDEDNVDQLPGYGFGSAYILRRIDGSWVEQQKLLPWDPEIDLRFGGDVAIHGTRAIVGATGADSYTGAVYFYHEIGGGWSGGERVQPDEAVPGDFFGTVVAIDVEVAVVGAPGDDTAGSGAGAAYILRNVGGQWSVEQKIVADDAEALDFFGWAVAIRGDTALISSRVDDDQGVSTGSVWVYRFLDGTWTQMQKLYASDADYGELFGDAVAMGEGVAVVSAIHHDSACPEDLLCNSGAAYVFRFEGGVWVEEAKVLAPDAEAGDEFGYALAIDGDTLVVGMPFADDACPGDPLCDSGAAYVFHHNGQGTWNFAGKLRASDHEIRDFAGTGVALAGGEALVGCYLDDDAGTASGSIYFFDVVKVGCPCPADLDGDGDIGAADLAILLGAWGPCEACPADFNGDNLVDAADLAELLGSWGPCD